MNQQEKKPSNPLFHPIINQGTVYESGATLRDYFANSAMQGMFANSKLKDDFAKVDEPYKIIAEHSYKVADAMLKAREL
jgi:hypothetical protein